MRSLVLNQVVAIFCDEVIVVLCYKKSSRNDHRCITYNNATTYGYAAVDFDHDIVITMLAPSNTKVSPAATTLGVMLV